MRTTQTVALAGCLLAMGLIAPSLQAQNFNFTTVAGGSPGSLDGLNFNAQFNTPTGVAVDGAGNVYVADQNNNLIRQVSPLGTNWIVTTIAGGARGSQNGTGASAQFSGPAGIAVDSSGNLYVADQFNSVIRTITLSGTNWVVSTIAGTAGAPGKQNGANGSARFSSPTGVALDGLGNIFVADEGNNAIRKITPSGANWIVSTIAGGTEGTNDGSGEAAQFNYPYGVAVDTGGRVFVADQFNNTIRLITPVGANWVVTTIAGQAIAGRSNGSGASAQFDTPVGVTVDANDNVYVADSFNDAIRKLAPAGILWEVSTIAGGSVGTNNGTGANAEFDSPFGVAADAYGDVFVADSQNSAIRLGISSASAAPTGGMEVTILPASAVSAGAQWQIDGGPFQASGAVLTGLAPGLHAISFSTVAGFTTPAEQTIPVTTRQTALATANYAVAVANAGSLQVMISPPNSINAGAQWQVDSGAWHSNGAIVAGLSVGTHTLSFEPVPGWTTPSSQTVAIINSQTTLAAGSYVLQTGSLQVSILPSAIANLAKWQVDGGAFQASGTTLAGLTPGSHTIGFITVLGWSAPADQQVNITFGQTTAITAIYVNQIAGTGALQVALVPLGAADAGAQWQIDGGAALATGVTVSNLAPGLHSLTFTTIAGWTTPGNQAVDVTDGQTTLATGTYVQQTGETASLQVTILPPAAANAGAQWQVDGGVFQASGVTLGSLAPGTHTVAFNVVSGWIPPAEQVVTILDNEVATLSATYHAGTDKTKPVLSITSGPASNAHLTQPLVVIEGKATDRYGINQVLFQLNNAGYQPATGTSNWSASLTLVPGPNIFDVEATDASGNFSTVLSRTLYFIVPSTLTVTTQGSGSFAPALNGKILDVGMPYTLTATPKTGNLFANWSGSLSSSNAKLPFIMQSNMVLAASFIPNPFIPQAGVFNGLFYDTNGAAPQSSGFFTLTIAKSGAFSANIKMGGGSFSATSQFDLAGQAQLAVPRARETALSLDLQLDFSNHLSGAISDGTWNATVAADHVVFGTVNNNAKNFAGQYTMALAGIGDGSLRPGGNGYATFSVNAAGLIKVIGNLADGTAISQTVTISSDGTWPLYVPLKGGGAALGWITFSNQPASTLGGVLSWMRPVGPSPTVYTAGFTNLTSVFGCRYEVTNGIPALDLINGQSVLSDLALGATLTEAVSINNDNVLEVVAGDDDLILTLTKSTGFITGSFHFPGTGIVTPIRGVILQEQGQALGYWLGASQSSTFQIQSQ
jgi:hypothetical protein